VLHISIMLGKKAHAGCSRRLVGGTIINGCPAGAVCVHLQGRIVGTIISGGPEAAHFLLGFGVVPFFSFTTNEIRIGYIFQ
jgi:hypothetical protein